MGLATPAPAPVAAVLLRQGAGRTPLDKTTDAHVSMLRFDTQLLAVAHGKDITRDLALAHEHLALRQHFVQNAWSGAHCPACGPR